MPKPAPLERLEYSHAQNHPLSWIPAGTETAGEYRLEPGSHLRIIERVSPHSILQHQCHIQVPKDARLEHFLWIQGGQALAEEQLYRLRVDLCGPGASYQLQALVLSEPQDRLSLQTEVYHQSPHTQSQQEIKNISPAHALSTLKGFIHIAPLCPNSQAHLSLEALMLHPSARALASPALSVYSAAVQCSHKAAVHALPPEALFALQTRGLSPQAAEELFVQAFIHPHLQAFLPYDRG